MVNQCLTHTENLQPVKLCLPGSCGLFGVTTLAFEHKPLGIVTLQETDSQSLLGEDQVAPWEQLFPVGYLVNAQRPKATTTSLHSCGYGSEFINLPPTLKTTWQHDD